jgi:2-aminoethylphosphonate-pyruvate transaminase
MLLPSPDPATLPLDLHGISAHLDEAARRGARFTHAAVVHHETTTGRLNDLRALGELCRARGLRLLPAGVTYTKLHDRLKGEGFVIYAGQGDLSSVLFRISTMGCVSSADMSRLLKCFAQPL